MTFTAYWPPHTTPVLSHSFPFVFYGHTSVNLCTTFTHSTWFGLATQTHTHRHTHTGLWGTDVQGLQAAASSISTKPTSPFHQVLSIHHSLPLILLFCLTLLTAFLPLPLPLSSLSPRSFMLSLVSLLLTFKPTFAFEHHALRHIAHLCFPPKLLHLP